VVAKKRQTIRIWSRLYSTRYHHLTIRPPHRQRDVVIRYDSHKKSGASAPDFYDQYLLDDLANVYVALPSQH
jgi:hypothetical protein